MPRGKRIIIEKRATDPIVYKVKNIKASEMERKREGVEKSLNTNIENVVGEATKLYKQEKLERERLKGMGLLSLEDAYEELKSGGVNISFRAFGGRVERRSVKSVKIGKKRLIPRPVIKDWIALSKDYYSVKHAFTELAKSEDINFRAFIGRIEKGSVPSIKIGTARWVPRDAIEGLTHVNKNYYDVGQAVSQLQSKGIKIKRNAFERRLDRNRIPHDKIGGRRFIAKEILGELVEKEIALRKPSQ